MVAAIVFASPVNPLGKNQICLCHLKWTVWDRVTRFFTSVIMILTQFISGTQVNNSNFRNEYLCELKAIFENTFNTSIRSPDGFVLRKLGGTNLVTLSLFNCLNSLKSSEIMGKFNILKFSIVSTYYLLLISTY